MTQQNLAPILGGILALLATIFLAIYICRHKRGRHTWRNSLPLLAGLCAGCTVLGLLAQSYAPYDRFFSTSEIFHVLIATLFGAFVLWSVEFIAPSGKASFSSRALAHIMSQALAAAMLVWAGVRFNLMKVPGIDVASLGFLTSQMLTFLWLIIAINIVRLLDGLHGAAAILVVLAGLTGLLANAANDEFFLTGVSLVAIGIAGGALWFSISPKRLLLEGSGTSILGLLFAILTVLARQKTVAATLLIMPVILIILIAGAAMLGLLEKRLLLPDPDDNETPHE